MSEKVLTARFRTPGSYKLDVYLADGGYKALQAALRKSTDAIIEQVKASQLRGRGGAGFPTGLKWSFVPKNDGPKYVCVNADEGEPGTFKDRYLMELDPHLVIEGTAIACYAVRASTAYIYVRGEFKASMERLNAAIAEARKAGYLGKNINGSGFDLEIYVHPGAGAYICGEETALINSNEGRRGMPRLKPPFPAISGLFGAPTVVNNVETLAALPGIITYGADWYAAQGTDKNGGTKLYAVSGHVKKPGLYELPMGISLRSLIYDVCEGMVDERPLKGVIPGGSSTPVLRADEIDVGMDFDALMRAGSMLGSGGVIVMNDATCMVRVAARLSRFYAHESCGQCSPCREGVPWIHKILQRIEDGGGKASEIDQVLDLCNRMQGITICPLADACAMPVRALVEKFRDEFRAHITARKCPIGRFPSPWNG